MPQLSLSDVFGWRPPEGVVLLVSSHHDGRHEIALSTCCSHWALDHEPVSGAMLHALFDAAASAILARRDAYHAQRPSPCATQRKLDVEMDRADLAFRQGVALARGSMTP
jgi:hypothetical protein